MRIKRNYPRFIRFIETPGEQGGGTPGEPPADDKAPANEDPAPPQDGEDADLAAGGLKALKEERAARKAAEKAVQDAQIALNAERNAHAATRQEADAEKAKTLRVDVALAEGVPLNLASRLVGTTRDELVADAKSIKESLAPSFVAPTDPSQGKGRGGHTGGTVEAGKELYQRMRGNKK